MNTMHMRISQLAEGGSSLFCRLRLTTNITALFIIATGESTE